MIGSIILALIGVGALSLGIKGFSGEGLPLTSRRKIKGEAGQAVGVCCFVVGGLFLLAALFGVFASVVTAT